MANPTLRELGTFAGQFIPGAGIADAAGFYPASDKGFNPSFRDNWKAGNYGTASLQALGALADLIPVAGPATKMSLAALGAVPAMKTAAKVDNVGGAGRNLLTNELKNMEQTGTGAATSSAQPHGLQPSVLPHQNTPPRLTQAEIAEKVYKDAGLEVSRSGSTSFSDKYGPSESQYLFVSNSFGDPVKIRFSGHDNGMFYDHDTARQGLYGALASSFNALGINPPAAIVEKQAQINKLAAEMQSAISAIPIVNKKEIEAKIQSEILDQEGLGQLVGREKRQAIANNAKKWAKRAADEYRSRLNEYDVNLKNIKKRFEDEISKIEHGE